MRLTSEEFRSLVARHRRMVFSITLRITGEQGTAEEVTQDVFWELVKAVATLNDEEHLCFWLRRVSVHRSTDALRKRQRQPEVQAEEWFEESHTSAENMGLPTALGMRIDDLLRTLPEAMRAVVVLRYQEDLTPGEIAKVLGQPLETVKSNLKRGLELMRRKAQVTLKEFIR